MLQFEVRNECGTIVGIADMAWPDHGVLGEFDGKVKYGRLLRPGETPGDAVFREKQREDEMRRLTGWVFVRLIWSDLGRPRVTARTDPAAARSPGRLTDHAKLALTSRYFAW